MSLDPKVEGIFKPHIADPVLVGLSWLHGEEGLVLAVPLDRFSIDEHAIGPAKGSSAVQKLLKSVVALGVPITDEDGVIIFGVGIGNRNEQAAVDSKATEASCCSMHGSGGIVDVASYLILDLEAIGIVLAWGNRAVGSKHSILPGVLPVLDSHPARALGSDSLLLPSIFTK
ncbi:hypothetical protein TorRG33x02_327410 [Trema orientale]|uniref:Uncharacterized protein n=1 Tax=Trema orientale TaxID=63057 RepID=A0A2P5BB08_TREOI|nr:hypothetical protein TorRG33x02_327410 [Trema orientale]